MENCNLPWNPRLVGSSKDRKRRASHARQWVQSYDVLRVEEVEGLHDKVQLPMPADFEKLQHTQVELRLIGSLQISTTKQVVDVAQSADDCNIGASGRGSTDHVAYEKGRKTRPVH